MIYSCDIESHFDIYHMLLNNTLAACPLIKLTRKEEPFEISPEQLQAISKLKLAILNSPALHPIDYESN